MSKENYLAMSKGNQSVQSVVRAFTLLELLGQADYHLGISDIAEKTGLPLATVHRLLNTLTNLGYVERNADTHKYTLGVRMLHLRGAVIDQVNLGVQSMPVMKSLMRHVNETVHLAVLSEGEIMYIERVEGLQTQGMYTRIGKRVPAHCTALGKVILAYSPDHVWQEVIARHGLPRFSATTITTEKELLVELEHIRRRGYATDEGETGEAVRCIARPIRDFRGEVVAALSVSGPREQMHPGRDEEVSEVLQWAVDVVSAKLGYRAD